MIESEAQIPFIGYGGMLMESFVAIMALVAASVIDPGVYFALNSPAALIGTDVAHAASVISGWGFTITPEILLQTAKDVGESSILSRAGGAPTLAVGMAHIFSSMVGGKAMMGFWYHFAILFEALFILTAVDAGTRVARFMIQDLVGSVLPAFKATHHWGNNLIGSAIAVGLWGYILYTGVIDPLGGINTLWPLFGISNQMLAAVALIMCTVVLFKMKKQKYAWVTIVPAVFLLICTMTAGLQKVFSSTPAVGFLSHARKFNAALEQGQIISPAKTIEQMHQIIWNDYVDATLAFAFVAVVIVVLFYGIASARKALANPKVTTLEDHDVPQAVRIA